MKKIIGLFLVILLSISTANATRAYFHYAQFYAPTVGTYLETYLAIDSKSVAYQKNQNGKHQASVDVTMLFYQADKIVEYRKYTIKSPEVDTTLKNIPPGFIDLQRIPLPEGSYNFELRLHDILSNDTTDLVYKDLIHITLSPDQFSMSGIEPVERIVPANEMTIYTKSGYDVIPYVNNFYPDHVKSINIYAEIYNIDKELGEGADFLVRYYVSSVPSRRVFESTVTFERRKASPIVVLSKAIDISKVPSGNYNLEIEIRDRKNELLLSRKHFFQRSSKIVESSVTDFRQVDIKDSWVEKYNSVQELAPMIRCLYPIAGQNEREFISKDFIAEDLFLMQQFFLNFWESRNNLNPEAEWEAYRKQVELVNKLFSTQIKPGYMTDRGRVYLQYGAPNQIIQRKNLSFFQPYEIWHYYRINDKVNRRFVFALINFGTNDYDLIHSDMPGEITTQGWIEMIKGRAYLGTDSEMQYRSEFDQIRRDYED
ncbi:MAG TPA: GWxTD domain-containing protein [Salinivirgaceae bacterium]|nr:GWxTD domain-containing protein [Salinivirgaceae bacterium]